MKFDNQTLLIGGVALVAGLFIFKDKICPMVPIPFVYDAAGAGGGGPPDIPPEEAMYAGYY